MQDLPRNQSEVVYVLYNEVTGCFLSRYNVDVTRTKWNGKIKLSLDTTYDMFSALRFTTEELCEFYLATVPRFTIDTDIKQLENLKPRIMKVEASLV